MCVFLLAFYWRAYFAWVDNLKGYKTFNAILSFFSFDTEYGKFRTVELADFIDDASLKKSPPDVEFEDADTHVSTRKYENMYYRLVSKSSKSPSVRWISYDTFYPLIGWPAGTSIDSQDTLSFSAVSGVRSMNEVFPLDRAAEAYDHMMSGKAKFRYVLTTGN